MTNLIKLQGEMIGKSWFINREGKRLYALSEKQIEDFATKARAQGVEEERENIMAEYGHFTNPLGENLTDKLITNNTTDSL